MRGETSRVGEKEKHGKGKRMLEVGHNEKQNGGKIGGGEEEREGKEVEGRRTTGSRRSGAVGRAGGVNGRQAGGFEGWGLVRKKKE